MLHGQINSNLTISRVAFLSASPATLDFVPDGVIGISRVNDRVAYHWIDNVKGINERQYGYNGDNGQPGGPTISGKTVTFLVKGLLTNTKLKMLFMI